MGVLNCQKCFNNDNKNKDEIITGNYLLKNQKVLFALDTRKTSTSPTSGAEIFNQNQSNSYKNYKDKIKKLPFKSKKEFNIDDDLIDFDYNTIEIPNNESDSDYIPEQNKNPQKLVNNLDSERKYKLKLKNEEELFGYEEDSLIKNTSSNIQYNTNNSNNIIDNDSIKNIKINEEIQNNFINGNKNDLNDFINAKIREDRKNKIKEEEKDKTNENNKKRKDFEKNNLNIGNNYLKYNYNFHYNLYNINIGDIDYNLGNNKYINQKIEEENEEYEPEKKVIDLSEANNKYKSSTYIQNEIKNIDQNHTFEKKITIKSEEIKTRKETKNEISNENVNYNYSNNYKPPEERSAISYEIEYIDDNNNMENAENSDLKENGEEIDFDNELNMSEDSLKERKELKFIENIEEKLDNNIEKIRETHNQYIITDAFCDYIP